MRSGGTTTSRGFGAGARVAVVVGLVVGLVGLGGCSGESGPTPSVTSTPVSESPSPSPEPTPTPTPTDPAAVPPERPAAMDTVDTAGAEAVATYYIELFPYVFATGDMAVYSALSHPECIFCTDVIRGAQEQYAAGGHSVGGLMEIVRVAALEVDPGKWWAVSMDVVQGPSVDLDGTGHAIAEVPEKAFHLEMAVVIESGHWLVRAVEYQRTDQ